MVKIGAGGGSIPYLDSIPHRAIDARRRIAPTANRAASR
jgi:hypothetical protein